MNTEVINYIATAASPQREIMEKVRDIILDAVPEVIENFKWSRPVYTLQKDFTYLQANKQHVNVGFYSGFEMLNDPDKLLQGTGKTMRHLKIKSIDEIDSELLSSWFKIVSNKL